MQLYLYRQALTVHPPATRIDQLAQTALSSTQEYRPVNLPPLERTDSTNITTPTDNQGADLLKNTELIQKLIGTRNTSEQKSRTQHSCIPVRHDSKTSSKEVAYAATVNFAGLDPAGAALPFVNAINPAPIHIRPNPKLPANERSAESLKTLKILEGQQSNRLESACTTLAINALTYETGPIPYGFIKQASATWSTKKHINEFEKIAAAIKAQPARREADSAKETQGSLEVVLAMRNDKLNGRATETVLAAISTALTFTGVGVAAKIPVVTFQLLIDLEKLRKQSQYSEACEIAAQQLHLAARNELNKSPISVMNNPLFIKEGQEPGDTPPEPPSSSLLNLQHRQGLLVSAQVQKDFPNTSSAPSEFKPATLIIEELFKRRSLPGILLPDHDHLAIIREDAGWMAIHAKLMQF